MFPCLGRLDENGGFGETRMPLAGSLLLDRIPVAQCAFVPFGESLEGEQHLAEFGIDVFAAVTADQRGMARPRGPRCDVGAVEGHATMRTSSNEEVAAGNGSRAVGPHRALGLAGVPRRPLGVVVRRTGYHLPPVAGLGATRGAAGSVVRARWNGPRVDSIAGWGASRCSPSTKWAIPTIDSVSPTTRWTGRSSTTARRFVVGDRHERTDYHVLTFAHRDECQSHPTRPGTPGHPGTADPARTARREPLGVAVADAGAVGGGPVEAGACP